MPDWVDVLDRCDAILVKISGCVELPEVWASGKEDDLKDAVYMRLLSMDAPILSTCFPPIVDRYVLMMHHIHH